MILLAMHNEVLVLGQTKQLLYVPRLNKTSLHKYGTFPDFIAVRFNKYVNDYPDTFAF